MNFVLIGFVAAIIVVLIWVRTTKTKHDNWLKLANLPGMWHLQVDEETQKETIEFVGSLSEGEYVIYRQDSRLQGGWRLSGGVLTMKPHEQASVDYQLKVFNPARIGIDGPDRDHQIFARRASNVIPLRRKS